MTKQEGCMRNLVCGIGINDGKYMTYNPETGKVLKEYSIWSHMILRCYSKLKQKTSPTYVGCSVSENFRNYSYFYEWCGDQIGFGNIGWEFDKDILIKGNKVYSETTCCFVPPEINLTFIKRDKLRGEFPIGVSWDRKAKRFKARCVVDGKLYNLANKHTAEEAFAVYKDFKESAIKSKAEKFKGMLDNRVYKALLDYEVSIDD